MTVTRIESRTLTADLRFFHRERISTLLCVRLTWITSSALHIVNHLFPPENVIAQRAEHKRSWESGSENAETPATGFNAMTLHINAKSQGSLIIPGRRKLTCVLLFVVRGIWRRLPASIRCSSVGGSYAHCLNRLVRRHADRQSYVSTFFLRNRPELQLLQQLAERQPKGATFRLCVLACSKGAEVYSIASVIRSARPDLHLKITAVDISPEIVRFAEAGAYSLRSPKLSDLPFTTPGDFDYHTALDQNVSIFEPMTLEEFHSIFEIENDLARVRPWLKDGITWHCADACSPSLPQLAEFQDIVVANCFLCHMSPEAAEGCLLNIASIVRPGGYLFVAGVDLDVRSRAAAVGGWVPVTENLREMHEGYHFLRQDWPLEYWGLEPLDESRPDWQTRYASVFRIGIEKEESPREPVLHHSTN